MRSAVSLLSCSRYSSQSGSGQQRSPERVPAARSSSTRASSLPMTAAAWWPRAMTTAPVRVAQSTMAAGFMRAPQARASARMSRPSASVLMTSTVLPASVWMTSPGFTAVPEGRFSDDGTMPTTLAFTPSSATACMAAMTAAPPDMSNFMSSMPGRRLDGDATRVEGEPLPHEHQGGVTLLASAVLEDDEPGLLLGAPGDGQDGVHALLRHALLVEDGRRPGRISPAMRSASAARCDGVATLPGRDWSVRAKFSAAAMIAPRATPASRAAASPSAKKRTSSTAGRRRVLRQASSAR